jgi:DNA-binding transcriptional MocR family regulator
MDPGCVGSARPAPVGSRSAVSGSNAANQGAAAGMQLPLQLPAGVDDVAIAQAAAAQGIGVRPLSPLHLTPSKERGLLLGYGRLLESRIEEAVRALSSVVLAAGGR